MRYQNVLLLFVSLFAATLTGCGDSDVNAKNLLASAKEQVKDMDFSSLSMDDMKGKVSELSSGLVSKLQGVETSADATEVTKEVAPALDQLGKLKGLLGDNMPKLDSLDDLVEKLTTKFKGSEGILETLKPVLEKLRSLTS